MSNKKTDYTVLAPTDGDERILRDQKTLRPFDELVTGFINDISNTILKDPSFRIYPELVAMAFWMRKANIAKLKTDFEREKGDRLWVARGTVFHIAPSNVDTIFVYSWFLSMMIGNTNIIRLSRQINEAVSVLIALIDKISSKDEFAEIKKRFLLIQYEHNDEITAHFSSLCDVRVIWGGDETIRRIRSIPIAPMAVELVFADKFSFSLIDAEAFAATDSKEKLINNFYNDAYWFGQNACSSPRLIVWLGKTDLIKAAREEFWRLLSDLVKQKLENASAIAVKKLVSECALAINSGGEVKMEKSDTSLVNRAYIADPSDIDRENHCGGGLFYEVFINDLNQIDRIIDKKDQTISVYGIDAKILKSLIDQIRPAGINRIVPIGQALDFSAVWDGYNLLREFCREIQFSI
jgi:hypothetical protein